MTAPIYIGIDPATSCGWAVLDASGARVESGVWRLATKRHEGAGMRYERLRVHTEALLRRHRGDGPVLLAFEEVRRYAGTSAAHVYGGIVAIIMAECERQGVPYSSIPVGQAKQVATGKGRASKDEMVAAALDRWSVEVETDDEADALWIAETLRLDMGGVA
jgi:Holliday junction resolvasome RuvABC endonuclease subunit